MGVPRGQESDIETLHQFASGLAGTYDIERELGGGGMSHVFVAMDRALGRRVVIKALRPDILEGISRERFRREVLLSANLQHPHIVGVIAAGEAAGLPYFVMPYVEGESLRAVLKREGRLSLATAVAILRDVARALSFAHGKGIVHRDIKPDNILLAGGSATVADFGVAKALQMARADDRHPHGTLTGVGISLGTPAYMAPEQVSGDPSTDHRADLYALGATAYEMVTGQPPFVRASITETMQAHLVATPSPLATLRPGVPLAFEQLVAQCLAKEAQDRPSTADQILELLADPAVVSGEVRSASMDALLRTRRRRWAIAASLVAAVALAGVALWQGRTETVAPAATQAAPAPAPGSLAIFPLVGIAADSMEGAMLAEGMTAALTNAFAGLPGIRVASSSSLRGALRDSASFATAARRLGVAHYVEGAVQRVGERIQVSVRLVNAADDLTIWSDVHDASFSDLIEAQNTLAANVAAAFSDEQILITRRPEGEGSGAGA